MNFYFLKKRYNMFDRLSYPKYSIWLIFNDT